jgi:8-oxo-dGTP pyrophosphatase MutT (NUDIX family)
VSQGLSQGVLPGLGRFIARNARDAELWARICRFVQAEPRAFTRDAAIGGHVTGSAVVLSPDRSAMLLMHHKKLDKWLQPGGHCDGIADARFVAQKEAYEETGLARITLLTEEVVDVDIHEIPPRGAEPAHLHYDARYLFQAEAGEVRGNAESHALAWVPLDRLEAYTSEASVLRLRDAARRVEKG